MYFIEKINNIMTHAFVEAGYSENVTVSPSKRPDLCQFQCNDLFKFAKTVKKRPQEVGELVVNLLKNDNRLTNVEFAPPGFINFDVSDTFLIESFNDQMIDKNYTIPQVGFDQTIVMDYGGPNVAKPLHVGHLRSANIGEALKRITRQLGYKVIADVHLGDWGLPLGLVIALLKEQGYPELSPELLYEVYPEASARSKNDEDFLNEARKITQQIQEGNEVYHNLWKQIVEISKIDIRNNYEVLNVDFDYWYGESDAYPLVPELMDILSNKGLLRESEGALVVDVELESDKAPMPPVIVQKSDGSSIYATTDLSTLIQRQKDYNPNKVWYVVDKRQHLHFEQVFRVAKKANLMDGDTKFEFLGFGTMNGNDGKPFKTRDGGIMRLDTLLEEAKQSALEKLDTKDETVASIIGTTAVKFADLINDPKSDYVFDLDKFLSFEGKTGSYILYNNVRINNVFNKLGVKPEFKGINRIMGAYDRDLILQVLSLPDTYLSAVDQLTPNVVAELTYQIANKFARFYAQHHVINEKDEGIRDNFIQLMVATQNVIEFNLDNLALDKVERM